MKDTSVMVFPFLSTFLRIFYMLIALCIAAASLFFYFEEQEFPIVGIIIVVIAISVVFSKDRWEFDCCKQNALFTVGFLVWTYKKSYPFSTIVHAETEYFTKGFFIKTPMIKCSILLDTGDKKIIALFAPQRHPTLQRNWDMLVKRFNG